MKYGIVDKKTGRVIKLDNPRNVVDGVRGFHKLTDEQKKDHGWYPTRIVNDSHDPMTQKRCQEIRFIEDDGVVLVYGYSIPLSSSEVRDKKLEKGFVFNHGGNEYQIKCDDKTFERLPIHRGRNYSGTRKFKFGDKSVRLSYVEYIELLDQVSDYIQQCYEEMD